ncbi:sugar phosphate isomerase/epimerase [bacterium]|nr:sugar phosphate isomerase/epimerase [bacterium]MBU4362689.1 sugar phosphate isomerase/epimerase [bacterium]MCG2762027.1 sugar phosphate isomerase/epimerase [Candidatus Atribacteria bacterium]
MKKSIVISTSSTKFSALAFKEDFEKSVKKVADLGFDGAELAIRNPKDLKVDDVINIIKENNLEVPAIGTGQAYGEEGLSFSDPSEIVRKIAVERIKDQIIFASHFDAQVIIGLIRGIIGESVNKTEVEEWTIDCLRRCTEFAKEHNIRLTLEPVNRYESNFINTLNEGIEFIKRVGSSNLGLLADTFHMNIEEVSIYDSIIQAKDYITHVHFADSNRWAPGCGHLDFAKIVQTLKKIGYQGYVSAEILPLPDPDSCARLTAEHLNKIEF